MKFHENNHILLERWKFKQEIINMKHETKPNQTEVNQSLCFDKVKQSLWLIPLQIEITQVKENLS